MPDYEKMYHIMFNAAQDAQRIAGEHLMEVVDSPCVAGMLRALMRAQQACEAVYIEGGEE